MRIGMSDSAGGTPKWHTWVVHAKPQWKTPS